MLRLALLIATSFFLVSNSYGQKRYKTEEGIAHFTSDAPLELIEATSNEVKGIIDPTNNQFAFTMNIKSFEGFNSGLQQEHFNEKYVESDKYPVSSFAGVIIDTIDFNKDDSYNVTVKGKLKIHGVVQERTIESKMKIYGENIELYAQFTVPLEAHDIEIPTILSKKIATEIYVTFTATMRLQSIW